MKYQVVVEHRAEKVFGKVDKTVARRIRDRLRELSLNPLDPRISKELKMGEGQRYARVGDWRIIFRIEEDQKKLLVNAILPRGEVYRNF